MANPVKILGIGVVYIGLGALFMMAIIGTISLDLLLLCILSQSNNRNNNFLATLFMWNIMLSNRSSLYENIGYSLLASPFISAISIGLSFAVGLPEFGVLLLAGWVGAFAILLAGAVIYGLGDTLENAFSSMTSNRNYRAEVHHSYTYVQTNTVNSAPQQHAAANQAHYGQEDQSIFDRLYLPHLLHRHMHHHHMMKRKNRSRQIRRHLMLYQVITLNRNCTTTGTGRA